MLYLEREAPKDETITCGWKLLPAPAGPPAKMVGCTLPPGAGAACEKSDCGELRDAAEGDVGRSGVLLDGSRTWLCWLCAAT